MLLFLEKLASQTILEVRQMDLVTVTSARDERSLHASLFPFSLSFQKCSHFGGGGAIFWLTGDCSLLELLEACTEGIQECRCPLHGLRAKLEETGKSTQRLAWQLQRLKERPIPIKLTHRIINDFPTCSDFVLLLIINCKPSALFSEMIESAI